jgi:hypothetical protein
LVDLLLFFCKIRSLPPVVLTLPDVQAKRVAL